MKAIRTITTAPENVASLVLSSIDKSFFHYEPCVAAFTRITSLAKRKGKIVLFNELIEDPALNEDFRDILRESNRAYCKSEANAENLVQLLDKYRKARILYQMAKDVFAKLKAPEADVDELLDSATNSISNARTGDSLAQLLRIIGKDANAIDLVDEALDMADEVLYKTGFSDFDDKAGGLPAQGVVILAGTTSGGKSTVLLNMLKNMYKINKISVCNASLEMNDKKQTRRLLSHLTQIPFEKFHRKRLTDDERRQSKREWRRLHKFGVQHACRFAMVNPTHAVNIQQLLMLLKPYQFRVIGIDYVSLLDTSGEKDQWKALSEIVRQCKIFSEANKCLVVLLAQLDSDDDHIRYAKGMLEHADNAWIWNYSKPEQRETKRIPVRQLKGRDQELFSFELVEQFEVMTVASLPRSESQQATEEAARHVSSDDHPDIDYDETGVD